MGPKFFQNLLVWKLQTTTVNQCNSTFNPKVSNRLLYFDRKDMSNWSDLEKEALLVALKKFGSENLKAISIHLPTKSLSEIEMFITKYAKRARAESREVFLALPTTIQDVHPISLKRRRIPNYDYLAPLDKWIEFIDKFNDCSFAVSRLAIAKTYKLIAESEEGNDPFIK